MLKDTFHIHVQGKGKDTFHSQAQDKGTFHNQAQLQQQALRFHAHTNTRMS